jgi:hypothetical protein
MISRRNLLASALTTFPVYAALTHLAGLGVARADESPWLARQQELALSLARGEITPSAWQAEVERFSRDIDISQVIAALRDARQGKVGRALPSYPFKTAIRFLDEKGTPRRLRFASALFDFGANDVITPHAQRHMVSAHLIVRGAFRVRNFDRVGEVDGALLLRETGDRILETGAISTMSTERDNVHWFVPSGGPASTFDVIVSRLEPGEPAYVIEPVDPLGGTKLENGLIRAPVIGFEESARIYASTV